MARDLTSGMNTAIVASTVRPVFLADIEFASETKYFWTGVGPITWNSHTYTGVGTLAEISPSTETDDLRAEGITLGLSGIDPDDLGSILTDVRQSKTVELWFGLLNEAGALIADPHNAFSGLMDVPTIEDGGDTATIRIAVENRLVRLQRPKERRYTDQDQQQEHAGDLGFQYVTAGLARPVWPGQRPDDKDESGWTSS